MNSIARAAGRAPFHPFAMWRDAFPAGYWLAGILSLATLARIFRLTAFSLWADEGFTVQVVLLDAADFLRLILSDTHPPLYYCCLLVWTGLFGGSEVALRSLSVFFGVLTVALTYGVGTMLAGRRVGLLAAALLALSPIHVQYSTEVRMYSLLALLATAAMWGAVRFATAAGQPEARRRGAVVFALGSALAVLTQLAGVFAVAPASLMMLAGWWYGSRPRGALRDWLVANAAVAAIVVAALPLFVILMQNAQTLTGWVPAPSLRSVAEVLGAMLAQKLVPPLPIAAAATAAAAILALVSAGVWWWRRDPLRLAFAFLLGLLPFILTIGVSLSLKPIFLLRIHLWSLVPLQIVIASAIWSAGRWRSAALGAAVMGLQLLGLYSYHAGPGRPDWRGAATLIAASLQLGDIILVPPTPGMEALLGYYDARLRPISRPLDSVEELTRAAADGDSRVWVVTSSWHDRVPPSAIASELSRRHVRSQEALLHRLQVELWTPDGPRVARP